MKQSYTFKVKVSGGKYHNAILYETDWKIIISKIKKLWTFNISDRCTAFELSILENENIIWQRKYTIEQLKQSIKDIKEIIK